MLNFKLVSEPCKQFCFCYKLGYKPFFKIKFGVDPGDKMEKCIIAFIIAWNSKLRWIVGFDNQLFAFKRTCCPHAIIRSGIINKNGFKVCHSSAFQTISCRSVHIKIINYSDSISPNLNNTAASLMH